MNAGKYALLGAPGALFASKLVNAGPADYVFTPQVVQGEREIHFKLGTAKSDGEPRASAASIGVGYGINEHDSAATSGLFLHLLSQKHLAYAAAIPFSATVLRT